MFFWFLVFRFFRVVLGFMEYIYVWKVLVLGEDFEDDGVIFVCEMGIIF